MKNTARALTSGLRFALAGLVAFGPVFGRPVELLAQTVSGKVGASAGARTVPVVAPVGPLNGSAGMTPLALSLGLSSTLPGLPPAPAIQVDIQAKPMPVAPSAFPALSFIAAAPDAPRPTSPLPGTPPAGEDASAGRDLQPESSGRTALTSLGAGLIAASTEDSGPILGRAFDAAAGQGHLEIVNLLVSRGADVNAEGVAPLWIARVGKNRGLERRLIRAGARESPDAVGGVRLGGLALVEASANRKTGTLSATFQDAQGGTLRLTNLDVEGRSEELGHSSLGLSIKSHRISRAEELTLTPVRIARDTARLAIMRSILPHLKRALAAPAKSLALSEKDMGAALTLVGRLEILEREVSLQLSSPPIPPDLDLTRLRVRRAGGSAPAAWVDLEAPGYRMRLVTLKTMEGAASTVFSTHLEISKKTGKQAIAYARLDSGALKKDARAAAVARRLLIGLRGAASRSRGPVAGAVLDDAIGFLERLDGVGTPPARMTMPAAAALPLAGAAALSPWIAALAGPLIGAAAGLALGWLVWKFAPGKTNKERWYPSLTLFPNAFMGAFFGFLLARVYHAGSLTMTLATGAVMLAAQVWMNGPLARRVPPPPSDIEIQAIRGLPALDIFFNTPASMENGKSFQMRISFGAVSPDFPGKTYARAWRLSEDGRVKNELDVDPVAVYAGRALRRQADGNNILELTLRRRNLHSRVWQEARISIPLSRGLSRMGETLAADFSYDIYSGDGDARRREKGWFRVERATPRPDEMRQAALPSLSAEMLRKLIDGGLESVIDDIRLLRSGFAESRLASAGFLREDHLEGLGERVYVLGEGHRYGLGQKVVFDESGKITLVSFAGSFTQSIVMDADGEVTSNSVPGLDR